MSNIEDAWRFGDIGLNELNWGYIRETVEILVGHHTPHLDPIFILRKQGLLDHLCAHRREGNLSYKAFDQLFPNQILLVERTLGLVQHTYLVFEKFRTMGH
jgi:hypothetical protein